MPHEIYDTVTVALQEVRSVVHPEVAIRAATLGTVARLHSRNSYFPLFAILQRDRQPTSHSSVTDGLLCELVHSSVLVNSGSPGIALSSTHRGLVSRR